MTELGAGSLFAGYRIEGVAGKGGMGVVYRATQINLDRVVALKLIAPEYAADVDFRERFVRESRTAASIEHPNVIPVYEAGEQGDVLFITMRYVDGSDLREQLKIHGRIDPGRTVALITQVGAALDAAHERGLVHRDVKPANVLVAAGDHVYLTDFGLTKRSESASALTQTGQFVGTYDYVAPEQIEGRRVDARTDVYALGCMLFHVLTGQVPYERPTDIAKLWAHVNDPPPSLAPLDPGLEFFQPVIDRAMAKDPDDRYASAGDLGRAAFAAAAGQAPVTAEQSVARGPAAPALGPDDTTRAAATPPRASDGGARPKSRRPLVIGGGVGALVVVGIAVALLAGGGDDGGGETTEQPAAKPVPGASATLTPIAIPTPNGVASVGSGVWVTSYKQHNVRRIDSSGKVGAPIAVGKGPGPVAAGDGEVWVVNSDSGTVMRVDTKKKTVLGAPVEIPSSSQNDSIVLTPTMVWVVNYNEGELTRIDRKTLASKRFSPPDGTAGEIAFGAGNVWVVGDAATVSGLDPVTGAKRTPPITIGRKPKGEDGMRAEIAFGEGSIWVALLDEELIVRVDPGTRRVLARIRVPDGVEGDIVVGGGFVYAVDGSGKPVRIDPKTNKPTATLPAPPAGADDATFADGALWISSSEDANTVTRIGG